MDLYQRIVKAKLFIDRHFDEAIKLHDIADTASFSRYHFIRLFKSIYGLTPHHYLTKVRIQHARLMLAAGDAVADVSNAVGFESTTSFTAVFKKLTGFTPSGFRQRELNRKENLRKNPLLAVPNCFAETHGWTKNSNF